MDLPITVGRFDGTGSVRGFKTMKAAANFINKGLAKQDPTGVKLGAYYVDAPEPDRYGRRWTLPDRELCPVCGQPDNCGDCTHKRLSRAQALALGAIVE